MSKIRIALLGGGWSGERDISLKSRDAVYRALDRTKYDVMTYDPSSELQRLIDSKGEIDLAFILLHGRFGEDGRIQGFLDILDIPFVGSGVLASAMALNKRVAKEIYVSSGLNVAKDLTLIRGEDFSEDEIMEVLGLEVVVKPAGEGSSLGMSLCRNREELKAGIKEGFLHDDEVLVEEYIQGTEVTGCVLGNRVLSVLPLVEIVPGARFRFFDHEAKYTAGATHEICPASLPGEVSERALSCARKAHQALGCSVWSRTDMIIRDDNIYLLETNTIPGMTENSLFPLAARAAGLSFSDLLDELIGLSLSSRE